MKVPKAQKRVSSGKELHVVRERRERRDQTTSWRRYAWRALFCIVIGILGTAGIVRCIEGTQEHVTR